MNSHLPEKRGASLRNMALLVLGFGLGQGSILIAQTWLVAGNQLDLLGLFGGHFAFAVLGFYIVDMGALTTMARRVVGRKAEEHVWVDFWSVSLARALVAVGLCVVGGSYVAFLGDDYSRAYMLGVAPGLLAWAVNSAGLLDGLRRSGLSGLAGCLPYVSSAAILPFTTAMPPGQAGLLLGIGFSLGMIAATLILFLMLAGLGHGMRFEKPNNAAVRRAFVDGGAMLAGWMPGQIFYRLQIVLSGIFLGPAGVGVFVYAKQIINAFAQLVVFVRRVEFPTLVARLDQDASRPLAVTFRTMKLGLAFAAAGSVGVLAAALAGMIWLPEHYHLAAQAVAWFAPVILTGAVFSTFPQGLIALGRYGLAARYVNVSLVIGTAITMLLVLPLGLTGLAIAEAAMHAISCVVVWLAFRRMTSSAQSSSP